MSPTYSDGEKLMALKRALKALKFVRNRSDVEFSQRDALVIESIIEELGGDLRNIGRRDVS